jgi:prepilin-type N-terminal cleavage/methylation domain-containing protein
MLKKKNTSSVSCNRHPWALRRFEEFIVHSAEENSSGFSLVELIIVLAILVVLVAVTIPSFNAYITTAKNTACVSELHEIDRAIAAFVIDKNYLPASLNDVGMENHVDPWKHQYVYTIVVSGSEQEDTVAGLPLNTDFDLYSKGGDGLSVPSPGSSPENIDDITRSNDGSYIGVRP